MKRNIYISNLDSPLSYHISQYFREDHLEVEPNLRIVGSSSKSHKLPWIHATINVSFFKISSNNTHNSPAELLLIAMSSF